MAHSRDALAATIAALSNNAYWRQYVRTLEQAKADAVRQLLLAPAADEALRGKAQAYEELLHTIRTNSPKET